MITKDHLDLETAAPSPVEHIPGGWNDLKWAIIFYLHFGLFMAAAAYSIIRGSYSLERVTTDVFDELRYAVTATQTGIVIIVSLILTGAMYLLLRAVPVFLMHGVSVATVLIFAVWAVQETFFTSWFAGLVYAIVTGIFLTIYLVNLKNIRLTAELVHMVSRVTHRYPSLLTALALTTLIGHLYAVVASLTRAGLNVIINESFGPLAVFIGIYIGLSVWWTAQVVLNILRTVVAGVFAHAYDVGPKQPAENPMPSLLRRVFTTAFGSVCLGSTLVFPIIWTRSIICKIIKIGHITWKTMLNIRGFFSWAARSFNYFAFNHVAMYDQSYFKAAHCTWDTVQANGVDVIMGDAYMTEFSFFACMLIAVIAAYVDMLVKVFYWNLKWSMCARSFGVAVGLGFVIPGLFFDMIQSGAVATCVCVADDPDGLQISNPELYKIIAEKYPQVLKLTRARSPSIASIKSAKSEKN
jgi:hypothetical protein